MLLSFPSFFRLGHFLRARSTILLVPNRYTQRRKPAKKKSSPKWDLLQGNLAEGVEKEVQHK